MGTIKVGQKNPKTVDMGGFTIAPNDATATNKVISAEEKAKQVEKIMQLPKEQIVPELRKRGFNEIADVTEAQMKQEKEKAEKQAESRAKRLAEIKAMPEEDQLSLLIEEGFEDEAKELSEKLALDGEGEQTDEGNGEENQANEANVGGESAELSEGEDTEKTEKATKTKAAQEKTAKKTK